ncbi:MAG: T9SS type A sorting domain-containing protein [Flavobacteriales bacterium]|nr:T9SS type A sorting domain-containing protein [Flavobacteriales bacterium]
MKYFTRLANTLRLPMVAGLLALSVAAQAQCTTWINPAPDGGWADFNTEFGGAPCDDGTGCPFNEVNGIEVWADEAYAMDNVALGGTYTFSACNGVGGTAWPLSFTIVAPSGAVDAFGLDVGSICELTWTASEAGTYLIVVSEDGACGVSTNDGTDNGFPAITCVGSAATACTPPGDGCTTWINPAPDGGWADFNTEFGGAPCDDGTGCPFNEINGIEVWADEAYAMDNVAMGGTYTFSACNGVGGTAWPLYFTVVAPSGAVDAFGLDVGSICELTWTASEAGTYFIVVSEDGACGVSTTDRTDNGFPAISCVGSAATACTPPADGCTTWINPAPDGGWGDFNTEFGGAPCDDGTGCPFNEINGIEVWADEAYAMDNVALGGTYTFSACSGVGGTAWPLYFTIIAPSGAVDAFGLDAGSNCGLTWTASEAGTYLIVVSEDGACGISTNDATDNGFPSITCVGSPITACAPPGDGCTTWINPSTTTGWVDFNIEFGGAPCDDGTGCPFNELTAFEVWADEAYAMENVALGGMYTFSACNGVGGTAWPLYFTIIAPSGAVDAFGLDVGSTCELTWTASEAGTYFIVVSEDGACGVSTNDATDNGFPAITCVSSVETMCVPTSVEGTRATNSMNIYPNPTNGIVSIEVPANLNQGSTIEVRDLSGRLVAATSTIQAGIVRMDLSSEAAGTYFISLRSNGNVLREKLVLMGR